jgi:asparagine synthetase A
MSDPQPMDTAPKDGTAILILCADGTTQEGWWYDLQAPDYVGWYSDESGDRTLTALHGDALSWSLAEVLDVESDG